MQLQVKMIVDEAARIPEHVLYDSFVRHLIRPFFCGDELKLIAWMEAPNPLLRGLSPEQMIREGRHQKLVKLIQAAMSESSAT